METLQQKQAYELSLAGNDSFDIAEALNITVEDAEKAVQAFQDALPTPSATEARRLEVARCDLWLQRVDAEYISQTLPIDKAVNSAMKLSERRCKLLGLDAPSRAEVTALLSATPSSVDEEIAHLAVELGLNGSAK